MANKIDTRIENKQKNLRRRSGVKKVVAEAVAEDSVIRR